MEPSTYHKEAFFLFFFWYRTVLAPILSLIPDLSVKILRSGLLQAIELMASFLSVMI